MSEDGADVILFPKAPDDTVEPLSQVKKSTKFECPGQHRRTTLDLEAHHLLCSDCDQVLDPFQWLVDFTNRWKSENMYYRQSKQQAKELADRVTELQRVERNMKARIRRGGLAISSKGARMALEQMGAMGYALGDKLRTTDDRDELVKRMAHFGYKPDDVQAVLRELSALCNLEDVPDDSIPSP